MPECSKEDSPGRHTVVFTACSANYLAKALAMCRSVLDHNPRLDAVILLVDRKREIALRDARVRIGRHGQNTRREKGCDAKTQQLALCGSRYARKRRTASDAVHV